MSRRDRHDDVPVWEPPELPGEPPENWNQDHKRHLHGGEGWDIEGVEAGDIIHIYVFSTPACDMDVALYEASHEEMHERYENGEVKDLYEDVTIHEESDIAVEGQFAVEADQDGVHQVWVHPHDCGTRAEFELYVTVENDS